MRLEHPALSSFLESYLSLENENEESNNKQPQLLSAVIRMKIPSEQRNE